MSFSCGLFLARVDQFHVAVEKLHEEGSFCIAIGRVRVVSLVFFYAPLVGLRLGFQQLKQCVVLEDRVVAL